MVVGRMTPGEDTPPESERALAVKKQHLERLIRDQAVGVSANLFAWLMMIAVRPEMVMRATKGDAQRAAQYLAGMTTGASLVEFILTPMLGRLSDTVGRRPFLIAAPAICTAARLVTFWGASNGSLSAVLAANWIDRCTSGSAFPLYMTVSGAQRSDVVLGNDLAKVNATVTGCAGLAVALAPFAGGMIMQATGHPKYAAAASSCVSALHLYYVVRNVRETLEVEKRSPLPTAAACNPFNFLRFFRGGKRMRLLSLSALLQAMPSEMHDTRMVMLKSKLGFTTKDISLYMLGVGASVIVSGMIAKGTLSSLGQRGHTHLGSAAAIGSLMSWAVARNSYGVATAVGLDAIGSQRAIGIGAMLTGLGISKGMGRGDIAGSLANMNTLTKVLGPLMYARAFARGGQRTPFMTAVLFILAAEAVFLLAKDEAPDAEERRKKEG